jgi:hypothetical protein
LLIAEAYRRVAWVARVADFPFESAAFML